MTRGDKKRQAIFNYYIKHLNFLIDSRILKEDKNKYICPICLEIHNDIFSADPLTLEDAPPASLGGSANILTCKTCNNTCGLKIDVHLAERMKELDNASFLPNSEFPVLVKIDNETLRGIVKVDAEGTMSIIHNKKHNHPQILEEKMKQIKDGNIVNIDFLKSRVIPENLGYALLKTAYLLAFKKFGYSLMLNDCFDIVRDQLLNPEEKIYPSGFWHTPPSNAIKNGVYFITEKGFESLYAVFETNTGKSKRKFGVLLPLPINHIEDVVGKINLRFEKEKSFAMTLYPYEEVKNDYLFGLKTIQAMNRWIMKRY